MRGLKPLLFFIFCHLSLGIIAQPSVLGTNIFTGSFSNYNLTQLGKVRQYRAQTSISYTSGLGEWLFCRGTASSPDYSIKWNPYTSGQIIPGFNTVINPSVSTGSARYNTAGAGGGANGQVPAITSGRYYTFNVGDNQFIDNYMAVWETTFNPVSIISTSQSPTTVCSNGDSITISVLTSSSPNSAEKIYLRYTRDSSFTPSFLAELSFSGSLGTVKIPVLNSGDTIRYYIFSSMLNTTQLAPGGVVSETNCDMSTLAMNNNSNTNFRFIIRSSPSPTVSFSPGAACAGVATSFVNNSTISSGTISTSYWDFGDASNSTVSGASNTNHTYSSTGTYSVVLTATSALGCQKSSTQSIQVNPRPSTNGLLPH
ncbi:MAG: PKD domain-containing protein [Bacteroidia bacterium]